MRKCHQAIVKSCEAQGAELLRPLVNKKSEGENLRLIEFSIFESKDVFEMIANLYVYLGLGREELRVLLDRIAEQYFMLARFSQGYNLCTEPLRKLFKNPCSQAELNKIVPFGFSLQRQKWCFFAIKIV